MAKIGMITKKPPKMALFWPAACFLLTGCATSIDTLPIEQGEYEISVDAPGGMYGSFVGLSPSENELAARAQELCPAGYRKVAEDQSPGIFAVRYRRWDILCTENSPMPRSLAAATIHSIQ